MNLTQTVQSPAKGHPIMAFILGLLSANNIAYAFVVGFIIHDGLSFCKPFCESFSLDFV